MPSTTSYQAGDVILVDFPFTVSGPGKPRPSLVILDTGDADVLLAEGHARPRRLKDSAIPSPRLSFSFPKLPWSGYWLDLL